MRIICYLNIVFYSLFFSVHLFAQEKVFSGSYQTEKGEKIEGVFTNYKQWDINPAQVNFTPTGASTATTLTPMNCRSFLVNGYDEYLSYSGKRLINPIGDVKKVMNYGNENANDQYADIATFLRLVIRTPSCELYILKDAVRTNFFLKLPDQNLIELRFKEYFDQVQIKTMPEYRQQLQTLFSDSIEKQKLGRLLDNLPYAEETMRDFFSKLFLSGKKPVKENKQADGWIISGGASFNFLKVDGDKASIEVGQKYKTSVSPLLSIGYMLVEQRNFGKYFFYPQLKIFRHDNSVEFSNSVTRTTISYSSDLILLPELNAGFNVIRKENLLVHLSVGGGLMVLANNQHIRNRYNVADGSLYFSSQDQLTKSALATNAAGGILIKRKFLLNASYQIPVTIGNLVYYAAVSSGVQLKFGYKFK